MAKIAIVGDIRIQTQRPILSKDLQSWLSDHALAICNLEGPVNSNAPPFSKMGPAVDQDLTSISRLKDAGFTTFALANNHIWDYGAAGFTQTLRQFVSPNEYLGAGLTHEEAYAPRILQIEDFKIGLLAAAEFGFGVSQNQGQGGFAWINHPKIIPTLIALKSQVDIVIVIVHAGAEDTQWPLPKWREKYQALIHAGADAVIATHTHTPQGYEDYQGKPIYYSLGNFHFDWDSKHPLWNFGIAVSLEIQRTPAGIKIHHTPQMIQKTSEGVQKTPHFPEGWALDALCKGLQHPEYEANVTKMVTELWEESYAKCYEYLFPGFHNRPLPHALNALWQLATTHRISLDMQALSHNLLIESHRWATTEYLYRKADQERCLDSK